MSILSTDVFNKITNNCYASYEYMDSITHKGEDDEDPFNYNNCLESYLITGFNAHRAFDP